MLANRHHPIIIKRRASVCVSENGTPLENITARRGHNVETLVVLQGWGSPVMIRDWAIRANM